MTIEAISKIESRCVLIVDDEISICKTLEGVFADEGIYALTAQTGEQALQILSQHEIKPDLVLLDIWLPGMDGIETLTKIKEHFPTLPVVMISGHATIATALRATRLGAADFIEKPLDLNSVLRAANRIWNSEIEEHITRVPESSGSTESPRYDLNRVVFDTGHLASGERVPQRTLARKALLYGQGLHSGKKSGLLLEPLPSGSGIHFAPMSRNDLVPAHLDFVESTGFATTVKLGDAQAGTIEHIMSALHAYGVSNLLIKCNGEVPVMDGSALKFCNLIEEIGLEEQSGDWFEIACIKPLRFSKGAEFIELSPAEEFSIEYTLEYPRPLGTQRMVFTLNSPERYKREIAPARTFGFVKDIDYLQKQGLALGGRFDNFVLFGEDGPINCDLRFSDEPVRHKILDAIGDLYLLGRKIRGKITARMTGHSDNIALLKMLWQTVRDSA